MLRLGKRQLLVTALLVSCASACGGITDTWTHARGPLAVRATIRPRGGILWNPVPNYRCLVEARSGTAADWRTVLELETDDPICVLEQDWHFVSETLAYGHVASEYLATTDGGRSWIRWDADTLELPEVSGVEIAFVGIEPDGRGTMTLHSWNTGGGRGTVVASTVNYGRTWSLAAPGEAP